ncbi:bifunctional AP-4-A phosphorylase/ADP sulfurylase [Coniothyrium glycines]
MLLGLSEALPSLVESKYSAAKASSSLVFSPTQVTTIRTLKGIPFQLRYCPSLAKKPVIESAKAEVPTKKSFDPFENPSEALHIVDIPSTNPSHLLVLNKFPIIAEHFIIATKLNKKQTQLLEKDDLEATYACLKAWQDISVAGSKQRRLFAFFNSGKHSGASQPHRHLQFLPFERMHDGEATRGWGLLVDLINQHGQRSGSNTKLIQHPDLPFTHFACVFDSEPSSADLLSNYTELYIAAKTATEKWITAHPAELSLHDIGDGDLPISYNLAITTSGMAILPRRSEGTTLRRDDGSDIGFVALNGTTLGGTMMVKHKEEWDVLREKPGMLDYILSAIGIPKEPVAAKSHV